MKVGIIGNYGHNNNGDEAILAGLLHQLTVQEGIKKENIVVFSNDPANTKERHGTVSHPLLYKEGSTLKSGLKTIRESRKVMKHLDLVIIGGGGLLMDMYKRDAPLYSVLGLTAKRAGCRVAIHGVGAGPIRTKTGAFFINRLLRAASSVAVRDEKSRRLLQQIGAPGGIRVIYDPAFSVPVNTVHETSSAVQRVGVTAVPYFSTRYWPQADAGRYAAYLDGMAASLDELIDKKGVEITFFSTKYPEDVEVTKDIARRMQRQNDVHIQDANLSPQDIARQAAGLDLVIGTRLHSLILSVNAETPVIGIAYHQKVKDFMEEINQQDYTADVEDLTQILPAFEKAEQDWARLQADVRAVSGALKEQAAEGMNLLRLKGRD
ncbi:polysaccharide pyruvyl transferase family protein [Salibacterium halotolerans]|nr:polysaccharide pyruvyl transferase family protein [Salibacterium halotolerans]